MNFQKNSFIKESEKMKSNFKNSLVNMNKMLRSFIIDTKGL